MKTDRRRARSGVLAYAEAHPEEVGYLNARELGERCGVSESTVIRAVQSAGYAGFPEFQLHVRREAARRRTTVERFAAAHDSDPLARILAQDVANLRATWESLSLDSFRRSVRRIASARAVHVLGLRMAHAPALILQKGLTFVGVDARLVVPGHGELWDAVASVRDEDVLVAVSFPRYTRATVEAAALAAGRGAAVISLTDGPRSPLAAHSQEVLCAAYSLDGYVESFTAAVSLVQALLVAVARERGEDSMRSLREKEALWTSRNVYWTE